MTPLLLRYGPGAVRRSNSLYYCRYSRTAPTARHRSRSIFGPTPPHFSPELYFYSLCRTRGRDDYAAAQRVATTYWSRQNMNIYPQATNYRQPVMETY